MTKLQQHVLDLAKRLHDSEVDRRNLQHEMNYLAQESDYLRGSADKAACLEGQVDKLKTKVSGSQWLKGWGYGSRMSIASPRPF